MSNAEKTDSEAKERRKVKSPKLPPKGTAERALLAAGLWSHMTREEIDLIKAEINSR